MSHPNAMKGEAEAKLADGRTIKLAFNVNAWVAIEEQLDLTMPEILEKIASNKASLAIQRAIMWGGLRKHHAEMSLEDAGDVMVEAAEAMRAGLEGGAARAEEGAGETSEDPPKRRRGAGTKA